MLIFLYLSTFLHVLLALYVLIKDPRGIINITFSLFAVFIAGWSYSNIAFLDAPDPISMKTWAILAYNIASCMLFFMYHFAISFIQRKPSLISLLIHVTFWLLSVIIVYIPRFVIIGINFEQKTIITNFGIVPLFSIYLYFMFSTLYRLIDAYRKTTGRRRSQLRVILLALTLSILFGLFFNLVLPAFKNYTYVNLGPSFSLVFLSFITYTIVKYQLFDIRFFFGKVSYYTLASLPPYFIYFLLAFIYEHFFGTSFNKYAYIIGIPAAVTFTVFVNFFNKFISEYTDSHLINPGYNPLVVLEQLRQRLASALDIDRIGHEALFIIARTIRPNFTGIILKTDNHENEWISINYKSQSFTNPEIFSSFIHLLSNHKLDSLVYEELTSVDGYDIDLLLKQRVREQMEKLKLSVVIPIRQDFKVSGLLLLGQKEANSPYGRQEVRFLISIAESTSLAVGRALLYQEIQLFNATLQKKVNDATQALLNKNKDLEDALGKLEEIRRQEKDMLDVMGHELRTPISIARNAVVTLSKEVQKEETDEEKLSKYAKMAIESIRREISLIETFLSTTKLEGDRMQINLEPINLREIMEVSIEAHKDLAERNKTKVTINALEKDIVVNADKIRIQEIADNFLNNAIKYTGEGNVVISMYEKEELGWIDIKDDGIGISPENLQKLGKKFFRAQTLYNRSGNIVNPSGTGLGLFVSFQLIDLMHGRRVISSKEGEGSTFSFGLPLQPS